MKYLKITLTFMLVLLALIFFTNKVKAISHIAQPNLDTIDERTGIDSLSAGTQTFITYFTSDTGAIYNVNLAFKTNNTCVNQVLLYFGGTHGGCSGSYTVYSDHVTSTAGEAHIYEFSVPTSTCNRIDNLTEVSIDNNADLSGNCVGGTANDGTWYGSNNPLSWPYGAYNSAGTRTLQDLYFDIWTMSTSSASVVDFDGYRPATTTDFNNWQLIYQLSTADQAISVSDLVIGIAWSQDGLPPTYYDESHFTSSSWQYVGAKIPKSHDFVTGTVSAVAYIKNFWTQITVASSTPWNFTVNDLTKDDYGVWHHVVTSTLPVAGTTCDSVSGFWDKTVCYTFRGLFEPSDASLVRFADLKILYQNKPPFGYVSIYSNAFTGQLSSTSTTSTISNSFATSTLTVVTSISLFQNLYTILNYSLWLLFGFYVYHRLRKLSLMG